MFTQRNLFTLQDRYAGVGEDPHRETYAAGRT